MKIMKKKMNAICKLLISFLFATFIAGCGSDTDNDEPQGGQETPEVKNGEYIKEPFLATFGSFSQKTIAGIPWVIEHGAATATGYDSSTDTSTKSDSYVLALMTLTRFGARRRFVSLRFAETTTSSREMSSKSSSKFNSKVLPSFTCTSSVAVL